MTENHLITQSHIDNNYLHEKNNLDKLTHNIYFNMTTVRLKCFRVVSFNEHCWLIQISTSAVSCSTDRRTNEFVRSDSRISQLLDAKRIRIALL